MARPLNRSQKAFILAMLVTMILALTPQRWLGWTRDVSDILSVPMMPFRELGRSVAAWLRPATPTVETRLAGSIERRLLEELDRLERAYHASELRARELEEQLEQLQRVPVEDLRVPVDAVTARVTARNPRDRAGLIELNRGRRSGVAPGTITVYAGAHLVGRVVDVGLHNCYIMPATSRDSDLIRAAVMPADRPEISIAHAPTVQLEPRGDGTFSAEVLRTIEMTVPVAVGDIVRLADHHWPPSAQATVVGVVESITEDIGGTLRDRIIVRPRYNPMQLDRMVLLIEADPHGADP